LDSCERLRKKRAARIVLTDVSGGGIPRALDQRVLASLPSVSHPSRALTGRDGAGFNVSALVRGEDGTASGGDFYTLAVRGPGRIGVIIGDACGRGADGRAQLARILP